MNEVFKEEKFRKSVKEFIEMMKRHEQEMRSLTSRLGKESPILLTSKFTLKEALKIFEEEICISKLSEETKSLSRFLLARIFFKEEYIR